jgi:hypothetical protein
MADDKRSNPGFAKEQAEGERDTVDEASKRTDRQGATPRADIPGHEQQGITNRPLEEEQKQQDKLPPRGEAKKPTPGGHA